jgi:hypothetical protein
MDLDTLQNLKRHIFYHGTTAPAANVIEREGFRTGFYDRDGRWSTTWGLLGTGVYLSCSWQMALFFGPALLRVGVKPGTRILDVSEPPDSHVLQYLQREFGRDILRKPSWKVLPSNKKLTLSEVVALVRFHYQRSYAWTTPTGPRGSRSEPRHAKLLGSFRSVLIRYGYDGYGDPGNDVGMVVFSPGQLIVEGVVLTMHHDDWSKHAGDGFGRFVSLQALRRWSSGRDNASQSVALPGSLAW